MNILILANHYPVASGRYAAEALRRLGRAVYTDGPRMGRFVWGMAVPPEQVWEPAPPPNGNLDLVIVMDSDPAVLDASGLYAEAGAKVVVWGVDNHVRDYRRPWFRRYFLAHKNVSVMPWAEDMRWFPCCYDPTIFKPGKPMQEREIDVALIGVLYEHRRSAIKELRAAGLKVVAGMGLFGEAMANVYQNAKISLCLSANHDLGQRVFETAACGSLVFTDNLPDLKWLMLPGLALWDGDDLTGSILGLLDEPGMMEKNALWTQSFVVGHTWDTRAAHLLEDLALDPI